MAKYRIVRACGHEAQVTARGPTPNRQTKLDRERGRNCRRCSRERERLEAEAAAEADDLPPLTGTPKQITWAMTLRHKALADADAYLDDLRESGKLTSRVGRDPELFEAQKERVMEPLAARTEATWWIDRREVAGWELLESLWDDRTEG